LGLKSLIGNSLLDKLFEITIETYKTLDIEIDGRESIYQTVFVVLSSLNLENVTPYKLYEKGFTFEVQKIKRQVKRFKRLNTKY